MIKIQSHSFYTVFFSEIRSHVILYLILCNPLNLCSVAPQAFHFEKVTYGLGIDAHYHVCLSQIGTCNIYMKLFTK